MFEEFKTKYEIVKDYKSEADIIKQDIDYLLMHYYRSRLNTKLDIIIVIPSLNNDSKNNLIKDMFLNKQVNWWNNLETFLLSLDIIDAFVNDIKTLKTGKRKDIVKNFIKFNTELKTISDINLFKYIDDLFVDKQDIIDEIKEGII